MPDNSQNELPKNPPVRRKRSRLETTLLIVGAAAIVAATAIWLYNEFDNRRAAENSDQTARAILGLIRPADPSNTEPGGAGAGAPVGAGDAGNAGLFAPLVTDDGTPYVVIEDEAYIGVLSIPRFSLNLPVNLTWSYPKLRSSPCRFSGDISSKDLVIAAHSYRSHFGNINSLEYGDEIVFTDMLGQEHLFYVSAVGTAQPSETRVVVSSQYDLTLFTCTYDSRARVVVRCYWIAV